MTFDLNFHLVLFDVSNGTQLDVGEIEYYPLSQRLIDEHNFESEEAQKFSEFLLKMLNANQKVRITV